MAVFCCCNNGAGPAPEVKPLEIVAPKGNEIYTVGTTVTVRWKINDAGQISSVGIMLSLNAGKSFSMLADHSFPPETTSVSWMVTSDHVSNQCVIKVYDYINQMIFDKSGTFSVTE
jgi:hypothetical protein